MSTPLPVINTNANIDVETKQYDEALVPVALGKAAVENSMHQQAHRAANASAPLSIVSPQSPRRHPLAWAQRQWGHAAWSAKAVARYGLPQDMYYYQGGLGDQVLITAVFRELRKRGQPPVVMMTHFPDLFKNNPDVGKLLPEDPRFVALAARFGKQTHHPSYMYENIREMDCHYAPPYPIIARMCKVVGIDGQVDLRPYLYLSEAEKQEGQIVPQQIAIMSSGMSALHQQLNKQWYPERFQSVVSSLRERYNFVQLGAKIDPLLEGVTDLRGKTSLRESAAILSQSLMFVGQIGFLMHLARAVDCRSVIVYGGREHPYQSGYVCNENLYTPLKCSPCWQCSLCDYDRECMRRITPDMVIDAVERQVERYGTPLPTDTYHVVVDQGEVPASSFARGSL